MIDARTLFLVSLPLIVYKEDKYRCCIIYQPHRLQNLRHVCILCPTNFYSLDCCTDPVVRVLLNVCWISVLLRNVFNITDVFSIDILKRTYYYIKFDGLFRMRLWSVKRNRLAPPRRLKDCVLIIQNLIRLYISSNNQFGNHTWMSINKKHWFIKSNSEVDLGHLVTRKPKLSQRLTKFCIRCIYIESKHYWNSGIDFILLYISSCVSPSEQGSSWNFLVTQRALSLIWIQPFDLRSLSHVDRSQVTMVSGSVFSIVSLKCPLVRIKQLQLIHSFSIALFVSLYASIPQIYSYTKVFFQLCGYLDGKLDQN